MAKIIKAAFFRYFRSKIFITTIILVVVLPFVMVGLQYLAILALANSPIGAWEPEAVDLFFNTFSTFSDFSLLFLIFAAIILVHDFDHNTIRNPVVAGYSKNKVFLSSFVFIISISTITIVVYALVTYLFAGLFFGFYAAQWAGTALKLATYLVALITLYTFVLLVSFTFRTMGVTILTILGSLILIFILSVMFWRNETAETILRYFSPIGFVDGISNLEYLYVIGAQVSLMIIMLIAGTIINNKKDYR